MNRTGFVGNPWGMRGVLLQGVCTLCILVVYYYSPPLATTTSHINHTYSSIRTTRDWKEIRKYLRNSEAVQVSEMRVEGMETSEAGNTKPGYRGEWESRISTIAPQVFVYLQ